MTAYVLILILKAAGSVAMTSIPDIPSRDACVSAGERFNLEVKPFGNYVCIPVERSAK